MTGIQIIGKEKVLEAFSQFDADIWGLFQGKQPIVFGDGAAALGDWLDRFYQTGSTATYTLRVYDADEVPTSSTAGAGYLASINFKLVDMYEGGGIAGHTTKLMQRIEGLEKKLAGEVEEPESEDINSIIMGWLKNPEQLGMVVGAFRQLMGMQGGGALAPVVAVGTAQGQAIAGAAPTNRDDQLARLSAAIDKLEKADPQLVAHLEKLATLATDEPLLFKAVISKLDAL